MKTAANVSWTIHPRREGIAGLRAKKSTKEQGGNNDEELS